MVSLGAPMWFSGTQLVALTVMLVAGALGGYVSLIFATRFGAGAPPAAGAPPPPQLAPTEAVLAGIAAAVAVPLLLIIASTGATGSLIGQVFQPLDWDCDVTDARCEEFVPNLLLLSAFCVVAGASARALITSLSNYLLKRIEENKRELDGLKRDVAEVVEPEVHAANPPGPVPAAMAAAVGPVAVELRVLAALEANRGRRLRSDVIAQLAHQPQDEVRQALDRLVANNQVEVSPSRKVAGAEAFSRRG